MAGAVPESWLECGHDTEENATPRPPEHDMHVVHDVRITNPRKCRQQLLGKCPASHAAALGQFPETASPPPPEKLVGGQETRALTKARHRSLLGAGPTARLRARTADPNPNPNPTTLTLTLNPYYPKTRHRSLLGSGSIARLLSADYGT